MKQAYLVICAASRCRENSQIDFQTGDFWSLDAHSTAEAEGYAMQWFRAEFPMQDGWQNHFCAASEIPPEVVEYLQKEKR